MKNEIEDKMILGLKTQILSDVIVENILRTAIYFTITSD